MIPLKDVEITSIYGVKRSDGKIHKGLDMISRSKDREVKAIRKGVVSFVGYDETGFGNYISILQADGYKVLYCHLEKYLVRVGQTIEEGTVIGVEGMTGNASGVHLHLELREAPYQIGNHLNPAEYLRIKNEKGPISFLENREDVMRKVLEQLIEEYGENLVYQAFRNLCEKEKYKDLVPGWAKEDFELAIEKGITDGSRPQALATRAETVVMIERAGELLKREG